MQKKLLAILVVILFSQSCSHIRNKNEFSSIKTGINHITTLEEIAPLLETLDERDLVVWDVDYVILTPRQMIGRPNAGQIRGSLYKAYGATYGAQRLIEAKARLLLHDDEELVDPKVAGMIKNLQKRKVPTIALTAYGVQAYGTIKDPLLFRDAALRRHGVSFNWAPSLSPKNWEDNMGFRNGIIGSGAVPKGQALIRFLDFAQFRPRTVVFVDDRKINVVNMQEQCLEAGMKIFYGFQYEAKIFASDPEPNACVIRSQIEAALENRPIPNDQVGRNIEQGKVQCGETK